MTERVAIVGARQHPNPDLVRRYVLGLPRTCFLITGGAGGVDQAAIEVAYERSMQFRVYRAQHINALVQGPGEESLRRQPVQLRDARDMLLYRNTLIALDCDRLVVFPDGSRGGCWDTAGEAVRFRRPVELRWSNGDVQPYSASMQKRLAAQRGDS